MKADIFYWRYNTRRVSVSDEQVEVPPGTGVVEILRAVEKVQQRRLSRRSGKTGVFEIQTDEGVWDVTDGGSLTRFTEKTGCVLRPQARFRTWQQLEAEERLEETTMAQQQVLRIPAIEGQQGDQRIYTMILDGKQVHRFATVSRLKRSARGGLAGYQRPEALAHVRAIKGYMESKGALVPNAVVVAFDATVKFVVGVAREVIGLPYSTVGTLEIPIPEEGTEEHLFPGFIVDGQQRLAAVRDAEVEAFPLTICAFIATGMEQQTEQFMLVNNVKPLPRALLHELLPGTHAQLPEHLQRRRLPAMLLERLNLDKDSPLHKLIITQTNPRATGRSKSMGGAFTGLIQDTAVLKALENSLTDGVLFDFCDKGEALDFKAMLQLLSNFWRAVGEVFPEAWAKNSKESRLTHGAGVVAMSLVMDTICARLASLRISLPTKEQFVKELGYVAEDCAWTKGTWDFPAPHGERPWNGVQNSSQDVRMLTDFLTNAYRVRSKGKAPKKAA